MSRSRLVFIDETGASTKMARRYGRCLRGERLDAALPHGRWKTTTFLGGLTNRGFIAPYVLDGAMDGPTFRAWIEQMLAPKLEPGDIVIMDNLPARKVHGLRQAIEAKGAELRHLPPYSPDLNPIEQAFAKLKALLPKAAERTTNAYRPQSASCSTASPRPNAKTTSRMQAIYGQRENALTGC